MATSIDALKKFVQFLSTLDGDEKSEAAMYVDRLLRAYGHEGGIEAGGKFEWRIRDDVSTRFADFVWPGRVVIEMKKRGEPLGKHYQQLFDYWLELVPNRPAYAILCNFDEFWIYDFNKQLREPVDKIFAKDLTSNSWKTLGFLFAEVRTPEFSNDRVKVTKEAANIIADDLYKSLISPTRPSGTVPIDVAQRYVLQCVLALFSEDAELLPDRLFTELLGEVIRPAEHEKISQLSYDLIGALFDKMSKQVGTPGGRFKDVEYFNGGLFEIVTPVELNWGEANSLYKAASHYDWSQVEPEIFGTLFQSSMGEKVRHAYGAHYTSPLDIMKVVGPTIVRPWRCEIDSAESFDDLTALKQKLTAFTVLDPACGSGNFLYVAYQELKAIERYLIRKLLDQDRKRTLKLLDTSSFIKPSQFYGMDVLPFAVELAKVTLMIAKEMAVTRPPQDDVEVAELIKDRERPLPLDKLDANIRCADALLDKWPEADAIIGNPPYQAKNKLLKEMGPAKIAAIRKRFPAVPGRADICVYWFRIAQDHLKEGGRAGLVGTNTIRQNYSREGGLDYIVKSGGVIYDAVSTQPWSGDAVVHVSIVNWIKPPVARQDASVCVRNLLDGDKRLSRVVGDKPPGDEQVVAVKHIGPSLSWGPEVSTAKPLKANQNPKVCFQGQTHGHEGFLLSALEARQMEKEDPPSSEVLFPYMISDDMLELIPPGGLLTVPKNARMPKVPASSLIGSSWNPRRYVIDFGQRSALESEKHKQAFERVRATVLPAVQKLAAAEKELLGKEGPRNQHLQHWWRHWRDRPALFRELAKVHRYIACGRVTKRPVFDFISPAIHPNDALVAFPLSDDYSFGVLQSDIHWAWFTARCSTMKADPRYTSNTVFDSFPWPQNVTEHQALQVAKVATTLRAIRFELMTKNAVCFRQLYRNLELPGKNVLRDAHDELDRVVRNAYGMQPREDPLLHLLNLNLSLHEAETKGIPIHGPGLPVLFRNNEAFFSQDCIHLQR